MNGAESLLRTELRAVTGHLERLGWTPLLLCDDTVASRHPYVLRVFSDFAGVIGLMALLAIVVSSGAPTTPFVYFQF